MNLTRLRVYVKSQKTPLSRFLYQTITKLRYLSLPAPKILFTPILYLHLFLVNLFHKLLMFFYWKPLFTQYLDSPPKHLNLTVSMPYVIGNPSIKVGDYCTINGRMVIIARTNQSTRPRLSIGNHVFIGFNSAFFIGNDIEIGDHCLISEGCILRGYSGHPLDPEARKAGLPDEESKIGRIVLENNVWLCQDVKINPGVRIGENSVIATGSIVTKDIPANVLAGGIPAEVIKKL